MTRQAVYAGSFDPWSQGHEFVLEASLEIYDTVHICVAVNPSKTGILSPARRSLLIAKSLAPFHHYSEDESSFRISSRVTVSHTFGLVSDFARKHQVTTLIRGLRSTSDFESEFNLYFANYAISPEIKTWTVLCPPELLHCSSTYVRTVVGQPSVNRVGTGFLAQCMLLERPHHIGEVFDLVLCLTEAGSIGTTPYGTTPVGLMLQQTVSEIIAAVGKGASVPLPFSWEQRFAQGLQACSNQHPDPFALTTRDKQGIYETFIPLINEYLESLLLMDLSDASRAALLQVLASPSASSCSEGLEMLWQAQFKT